MVRHSPQYVSTVFRLGIFFPLSSTQKIAKRVSKRVDQARQEPRAFNVGVPCHFVGWSHTMRCLQGDSNTAQWRSSNNTWYGRRHHLRRKKQVEEALRKSEEKFLRRLFSPKALLVSRYQYERSIALMKFKRNVERITDWSRGLR